MPLDPQVLAFLRSEEGKPSRSALSIAETRAGLLEARVLAGTPPSLPRVEDRLIPAEGREIPVRIYSLHSRRELQPALVYLHGGRFISGGLESHDPLCRSLALLSGRTLVAVDYRLAPEHPFPAALEDTLAVLDYLDRAGGRHGVDPRGLAVGGDSAGGNLAAAAALIARDRGGRRPVAQVLIYPMLDATCGLPSHAKYGSGYGAGSDDMRRGYREYLPAGVDPTDFRVSPLWAPDLSGLPPTLVLTAEFDCLADEGERYGERLVEAGVPVIHRCYPGLVHGFLQMAGIWDAAQDAFREVATELRRMLPDSRQK